MNARVHIVENTTGAWRPGCAWTVDLKPLLDIGRGRDEHDLLAYVSSVALLPTGRVLIGNNGTQSVPAFGLDGRFAGSGASPATVPQSFGPWARSSFSVVTRCSLKTTNREEESAALPSGRQPVSSRGASPSRAPSCSRSGPFRVRWGG